VEVASLEKVDWEGFLEKWIEGVRKRLEEPLRGLYNPDPLPPPSSAQKEGTCEYCPFPNLCGFEEQKEGEADNSEDGE
jgi:hypothetical protein